MCLAREREVGLHVRLYPGFHLNVKGNFGNGRSKKKKKKKRKQVWSGTYSGWVEYTRLVRDEAMIKKIIEVEIKFGKQNK